MDDRQIRQMLQDAEEKVPSGVWDAVSSSLDKLGGATPVRKPSVIWKWAGAAVAAAAAIAAILFIPRSAGVQNAVEQPGVVAQLLEESSGCVAGSAQVAEENAGRASEITVQDTELAPVRIAKADKPVVAGAELGRSHGRKEAEASGASESAETPETSGVEGALANASKEEAVQVQKQQPVAPAESRNDIQKEAGTASSVDLLAKMEREDLIVSRKSSGMDIVVGGTLAGNTASKLTVSTMSFGSPNASSKDVITEKTASSFGIPFTLGAGVRWQLTPRFAIGTGLDYSLLTRTFSGTFTPAGSASTVQTDFRNTMHYLGIPLNIFFSIVNSRNIDFYVYGGGEIEYCVANRFYINQATGSIPLSVTQKVDAPQFSAKVGVGVQFRLTDFLGLYLDPGVGYYFYSGQPKSIRTEQPLMFNFNAGLRFDI